MEILKIFVGVVLMAKLGDAICCDSIKSQVEKKIEANKTLCFPGNTLPPNCCKDIASEVEKYVAAFTTFCSNSAAAMCPSPKPLGMQSGKIPDVAITASSAHSNSYKPSFGRLNTKFGNCAWTTTGGSKINSWFQVDLGQKTILTGIATQGSCVSSDWTKSYKISYSIDAKQWKYYQESGGVKVFQANGDNTDTVSHSFEKVIHARYMRVLPVSWHNFPALRVEYYGCRQ